jgi:hypothetical protein
MLVVHAVVLPATIPAKALQQHCLNEVALLLRLTARTGCELNHMPLMLLFILLADGAATAALLQLLLLLATSNICAADLAAARPFAARREELLLFGALRCEAKGGQHRRFC